ncbi:glycosyltransferase family 9 protein [Gemmatimonas sp.]|uniref:glycosyltransferase family 9 protein n=1 Tax=Gemmatimonas sp. TaxID=1962908 RepID=UPI0037BE5957
MSTARTDVTTSPPLPPLRLERVGLVMMSAVGDAVHVMPIIHALKAHAPRCHVSWVLQPGPATLVRGHPLVDDIVLFDRSKGWRGFLETRAELATRQFDVVLGLQVYFKAGLITGFTQAPVKLGFDTARARDANWLFTTHRIAPHVGQHVQDQYFEFLDALSVPHDAPQWTLGPWNAEEREWQRSFLAQFDRPIAPIVVATSKAAKDWMPERWAQVCHILWNDYGLQPVLVGGRSERELAAEAVIMRDAPMAHSALGSGLRKLSAILDGAAVALSPDTGPLHLAIALRTPVISLLGYTNPKRVGPYDFAHDLMIDAYGDPGEDYPLDMVYREGRLPRITVQHVAEKLVQWQRAYAPARLQALRDRGLTR